MQSRAIQNARELEQRDGAVVRQVEKAAQCRASYAQLLRSAQQRYRSPLSPGVPAQLTTRRDTGPPRTPQRPQEVRGGRGLTTSMGRHAQQRLAESALAAQCSAPHRAHSRWLDGAQQRRKPLRCEERYGQPEGATLAMRAGCASPPPRAPCALHACSRSLSGAPLRCGLQPLPQQNAASRAAPPIPEERRPMLWAQHVHNLSSSSSGRGDRLHPRCRSPRKGDCYFHPPKPRTYQRSTSRVCGRGAPRRLDRRPRWHCAQRRLTPRLMPTLRLYRHRQGAPPPLQHRTLRRIAAQARGRAAACAYALLSAVGSPTSATAGAPRPRRPAPQRTRPAPARRC